LNSSNQERRKILPFLEIRGAMARCCQSGKSGPANPKRQLTDADSWVSSRLARRLKDSRSGAKVAQKRS
jgi:hypothetical protein